MADESRIRAPILGPVELAFLIAARRAVLATIRPDGRPRLVPICFVLSANPDAAGPPILYSPIDEKPKTEVDPRRLARVRDLLARPDVEVLVDRWDEDWSALGWVRLDGLASLLEPADSSSEHAAAVAALRAKYQQYLGHDLEGRPIIRIAVTRARGWGAI